MITVALSVIAVAVIVAACVIGLTVAEWWQSFKEEQ